MLETKRLLLREMTENDWNDLCEILQDEEVMYAYEHAFSDEEVREWLDRQLARYEEYGHRYGLWAAVLKETGEMVGQAGLTMQDFKGGQVLEIGYLFKKRHWHKGYAIEAAAACKNYAFEELNEPRVYSIIRDSNTASQNVAARNGMKPVGTFVKHYYNMDMPHILFCVEKEREM